MNFKRIDVLGKWWSSERKNILFNGRLVGDKKNGFELTIEKNTDSTEIVNQHFIKYFYGECKNEKYYLAIGEKTKETNDNISLKVFFIHKNIPTTVDYDFKCNSFEFSFYNTHEWFLKNSYSFLKRFSPREVKLHFNNPKESKILPFIKFKNKHQSFIKYENKKLYFKLNFNQKTPINSRLINEFQQLIENMLSLSFKSKVILESLFYESDSKKTEFLTQYSHFQIYNLKLWKTKKYPLLFSYPDFQIENKYKLELEPYKHMLPDSLFSKLSSSTDKTYVLNLNTLLLTIPQKIKDNEVFFKEVIELQILRLSHWKIYVSELTRILEGYHHSAYENKLINAKLERKRMNRERNGGKKEPEYFERCKDLILILKNDGMLIDHSFFNTDENIKEIIKVIKETRNTSSHKNFKKTNNTLFQTFDSNISEEENLKLEGKLNDIYKALEIIIISLIHKELSISLSNNILDYTKRKYNNAFHEIIKTEKDSKMLLLTLNRINKFQHLYI